MNESQSPVALQISSATVVKIISIILLFVALYLVRDVVLVVLAAIVIASAIEPATKWFLKYKVGRLPAVVTIYAIIALLALGIFYFLLPPFLADMSELANKLPAYFEKFEFQSPISPNDVSLVQESVSKFQTIQGSFPFSDFISNIQQAISKTSEGLLNTLSFIFGGLLSFGLILVLSFYLSVQDDGVVNFLRVITPVKSQKYVIDLWRRSQVKIGLWMQGQLLLILIIAILVFLGLTILGVKGALFLAILAGVFELIPVFGPIISAIPAVLVAIFDGGGVTTGLLVVGLYLIIQQFENHLIYPLVVRKIVGVSPIVVILALIVGAKLGGFMGVLLAVPVASALMEYFNDVQRFKMDESQKLNASRG